MQEKHFLKNNIVYTQLKFGCPDYGAIILPIFEFGSDEYYYFSVPYNDSNTWETEGINKEDIHGIDIAFTPLFTLLGITIPDDVPPHIEFFHELQNWYFYTHNKHLVDLEKFDHEDGEKWIAISKEYRKFCGQDEAELYELRNP